MYSAQQIKNFIPQNSALNAPRRINYTLPLFEQKITVFNHGFPVPSEVDGGLKYEESKLMLMKNAGRPTQEFVMYPCIAQPSAVRVLNPEPIADTNGFQAPFGYARGQPRGIASIDKRDALFAQKVPLQMSTNTTIAPMMPINPF